MSAAAAELELLRLLESEVREYFSDEERFSVAIERTLAALDAVRKELPPAQGGEG